MRAPPTPDHRLWEIVRARVAPLGGPPRPSRSCVGRIGRAAAPRDIDLHGDTVQGAYERVGDALDRARRAGRREILVVTGLSGRIRREFPTWAALAPGVAAIEPVNGGGAYRVRLARS